MAGPGPWTLFNDFKLNVCSKVFNLASDAFSVALVTVGSTALAATLTPATYAGFSLELANGNGYTTGGASAATPGLTGGGATATITWDTADVSWTASGSGFTARGAVIYDTTDASKHLVAFMLLDSTPADVTVASGNTLTIQIANIFTLT